MTDTIFFLMPVKMMFFVSLLTGILISVSASSWVTAWMGLEVNLISFLPLVMSPSNKLPNESALKYFLSQTIASSFLMLAILVSPHPHLWSSPLSYMVLQTIIVLALLLKLGAVPFHFWFPPTMEGLSWVNCIILSTVQKIAPLVLITSFSSTALVYLAMGSALTGAAGGYNQLSLRKLISYSSIGHLGWLLTVSQISNNLMTMYLTMYIYMTTLVMLLFTFHNIHHLSQMMFFFSGPNSSVMFMNILSLGGLPPFLGFLPKWLTIQALAETCSFAPLLILILSSLITLFYYMRITYATYTKNQATMTWNTSKNTLTLSLLSAPSLLSLPLLLPLIV